MSYVIFVKDKDNLNGFLYRIAENISDLNNLNFNESLYKILEVTQDEFNLIKLNIKNPVKYINNEISYEENSATFNNKKSLFDYILSYKKNIKDFIDNNPNHSLFTKWNNYYNQLNSLDLDSITYPLNKSLEQYFNDLGQPYLNPLQIP
jgi:hypothetical protein